MTVSFGHASHLATVWIAELTPTSSQIVSTLVAMLAMAVILTAVAALFAVFCLEKPFTWARTALTLLVSVALVFACAGGLHRVTGTHSVNNATPRDSQAGALAEAKAAALPHGSWTVGARAVPAAGRTLQSGWTTADLRTLATNVATAQHMRLGYAGAPAVIDTTHMSDQEISQHGTSFVRDGAKLRCVVALSDVVKNNVGQPVSAHVDTVHCVPAAPAPASAKTSS